MSREDIEQDVQLVLGLAALGLAVELDPEELAWARTMKGDEDVDEGKPGFLRAQEGGNGEYTRATNLESHTQPIEPAQVRLRVERQTLRRLPKTGAIVFTIRVYMTPLKDLAKEPDIPGRLASAIRSWPEDVARYVSCMRCRKLN